MITYWTVPRWSACTSAYLWCVRSAACARACVCVHACACARACVQEQQELLQRVAGRVRAFAQAQRDSISDVHVRVPGGLAGHTVAPMASAGCYAPGGRYPLPSSVLMTAITARVAGVARVWVASPRPAAITIAAAYVAGADALLAVGGAQAIAALAYGVGKVPACDVIVGPGNRWVTAAKAIVSGHCAIDMLAGPSECLVLADEFADAGVRGHACRTATLASCAQSQVRASTRAAHRGRPTRTG